MSSGTSRSSRLMQSSMRPTGRYWVVVGSTVQFTGLPGRACSEECRALGGCDTGDAKVTGGYGLPAAHVIHTVGPIWSGGDADEDRLLASCYRRSMEVAVDNGLRSIAFPAISTGVYGFPVGRAAKIAVRAVASFLSASPSIAEVIFCCFSEESAGAHQVALGGSGWSLGCAIADISLNPTTPAPGADREAIERGRAKSSCCL